jgi:hypothetical protein
VDAGAIAGAPDGTFKGELSVTRAEFAAMTNKYLNIGQFKGIFRPKEQ